MRRQPNRLSRTPIAALCMTGIAMGTAPLAFAQEPMGSLDELVVVGNRAPSQISEVPGTVWVLEGEELERQFESGQSLKDTLGKLVQIGRASCRERVSFTV